MYFCIFNWRRPNGRNILLNFIWNNAKLPVSSISFSSYWILLDPSIGSLRLVKSSSYLCSLSPSRSRSRSPSTSTYLCVQCTRNPYFDYCSTVWGNCGIVLRNKLQKLQNRAARIITRSGYEIRSTKMLTALNWCNLETRRNQQKGTLMYKIVNGMSPRYLNEMFIPLNEAHGHNLRNSEVDVKIPLPKSEYLKRSFTYSGAVLWNGLPSMIKTANSVNIFKNLIHCHKF